MYEDWTQNYDPEIPEEYLMPDIPFLHGRLQAFFPGVGKLRAWGFRHSAGSINDPRRMF